MQSQEDSLNDAYKQYGQLEGGIANISYQTGWQQNLEKLKSDNTSDTFVYAPTSNAIYYVSYPGGGSTESDYLASIPALLSYSVNGVGYVPWGSGNTTQNMSAMTDTLAATLRLSLAGACPVLHPDKFDVPKSDAGIPLFNISASYNYAAAYRRNITATYNLYKFYELRL